MLVTTEVFLEQLKERERPLCIVAERGQRKNRDMEDISGLNNLNATTPKL
jgi:hypothetical protein